MSERIKELEKELAEEKAKEAAKKSKTYEIYLESEETDEEFEVVEREIKEITPMLTADLFAMVEYFEENRVVIEKAIQSFENRGTLSTIFKIQALLDEPVKNLISGFFEVDFNSVITLLNLKLFFEIPHLVNQEEVTEILDRYAKELKTVIEVSKK